jgi:hypothetical protein
MSTSPEALLAFWAEHRQQLRQSEDQRAASTNYALVIVAGLSGLIVQQRLTTRTIPLCLLVTAIGLYGALMTAKYHERAEYHLSQARALTRTLVSIGALPPDESELDDARDRHYQKFPRLSRLRLHALWTGIHLGVAVFGLALAMTAAIR